MDNGEQKKSLKELLDSSSGSFEKDNEKLEELETEKPAIEENQTLEMETLVPTQVSISNIDLPDSFSEAEINGTTSNEADIFDYEKEPIDSSKNYEYDEPKKINFPLIIGGVILLIVVIVLLVIFTGKEKTPEIVEKIQYKVNYLNYTFTLPEGYSSFYEDDSLFIYPENKEFMANIFSTDGVFDVIKGSLITIRQKLEKDGFIITNNELRKVSGRDYIVFEVKYKETIGLIAFSKLTDAKLIATFVHNTNSTMDYQMIEKITPILEGLKLIEDVPEHLTKETIDFITNAVKEDTIQE